MSEELINLILLQINQNTSQEIRNESLELLLNIENNPNSVLIAIEGILITNNNQIKENLALSLKRMLKNSWEKYLKNSNKLILIKEQIIKILNEDFSLNFFQLFIFALEPIFNSEANSWNELFELINLFYLKFNEKFMLIVIILIKNIINKISISNHEEFSLFFINIFQWSIQQNSLKLISESCEMLSLLIKESDEIFLSNYNESFQQMFLIFINSFQLNQSINLSLCHSIEKSISTGNLLINIEDFWNNFKNLIFTENFPINLYSNLFIVIETLIEIYSNYFNDLILEIFQIIIHCSNLTFINDFFEYNIHLSSLTQICLTISKCLSQKEYFQNLIDLLNQSNENEKILISIISMFYYSINGLNYIIEKNLPEIINLIIYNLNLDSILIKEISLLSLIEISKCFTSNHLELSEIIIQNIIQYFNLEILELIKPSLIIFQNIFNNINISNFLIPLIIENITFLFNLEFSKQIYNELIETISSLIFSTQGDVIPYIDNFIPLLKECSEITDEQNFSIKGYSLEALSNLIQFFPNQSEELLEIVINNFLNFKDSNDLGFKISLMSCLQKLIRIKIPGLEIYSEQIQNFIITTSSLKLFIEDENGEVNLNSESLNVLSNSFLLMKCIFKYYHSLLPEDPSQWFDITRVMISVPFEDTQIEAMNASVYEIIYLINNLHGIPLVFYEEYEKNLLEGTLQIIGITFQSLTKLLKNKININIELFNLAIKQGELLIIHKHKCFEEEEELEEDNNEENQSNYIKTLKYIYEFFINIIKFSINNFPINNFIDYGKKIILKENYQEITLYIKVLRKLYKFKKLELHLISKKIIIQYFHQTLEISNFNYIPESIKALKDIINNDFNLFNIDLVINYLFNLLNIEFIGQQYYWDTIFQSISLILTLINQNQLNIENWIEIILIKLPIKGKLSISNFIYNSLINLFNLNSNLILNYGEILLKSLIITLSFRDNLFNKCNFTNDTLNLINNYILKFINLINNDYLLEIFQNDEISINRFNLRLKK